MSDTKSWDLKLPAFVFVCNNSIKDRLTYPPFFLMHGCYPRMPVNPSVLTGSLTAYQTDQMVSKLLDDLSRASAVYREQRDKAAQKDKSIYDYSHKEVDFEPGEVVFRYIPRAISGPQGKFAIPWTGPYVVVSRIGDKPTYRVKDERNEEHTVHASQLASFAAFSRMPRKDDVDQISPTMEDVIAASEALQRDELPSERKDAKVSSRSDRKRSVSASSSSSSSSMSHSPVQDFPSLEESLLGLEPSSTTPSLHPHPPGEVEETAELDSVTPEKPAVTTLEPKGVDEKIELRDKFVLIPALGRTGEEFLEKIIGDDLLAQRWTAIRTKGPGPGKTFGPLYYDEVQMKHETLTQKQISSGLKGRTPDLAQLKRSSILAYFDRLDKRRFPNSFLDEFIATYSRPPIVSWKP